MSNRKCVPNDKREITSFHRSHTLELAVFIVGPNRLWAGSTWAGTTWGRTGLGPDRPDTSKWRSQADKRTDWIELYTQEQNW
jgi:hypothetical protein